MNDINADHHPRSRSEKAGDSAGVDRILEDWSDPTWLQFSMWDLHQIRAYLLRTLDGER